MIGALSFGAPLLLAALVILPAIWWLLRVTPPSPRRIAFPPLRLLLGLQDKEQTPARMPLWLLLLRIIAAGLLIVALAQPLWGEKPVHKGEGPLLLFVDNGWTAAREWEARVNLMSESLRVAERDGRPVAIIATADRIRPSLLDAGQAGRMAREMTPHAWMGNRLKAAAAVAKMKFPSRPEILWLSDGLEDGNAQETASLLSKAGKLRVMNDAVGHMPLALHPPTTSAKGFNVTAVRSDTSGGRGQMVTAQGSRGETLAETRLQFEDGKDIASGDLVLPLEMRNKVMRVILAGENSAGAVQLIAGSGKRRSVGIVSASERESEQPLLSDLYYLERALGPYSEIRKGTLASLIAGRPAVLILADVGRVVGSDADKLTRFVQDGGLLIRFAGERMTAESDSLVPVKLRTGGRYLGSALAWSEPQSLAPFGKDSPFEGLNIPKDVTVTRQILAEPSVGLADHAWARLTDGTPLVTAKQEGKGFIVLFHVTASPSWSSLPLSGLYVDMLRRLMVLSSGAKPSDLAPAASLAPRRTLDGFGRFERPGPDVTPIRAADAGTFKPSREHPPGLYGTRENEIALNTVDESLRLLPFSLDASYYSETRVIQLGPPLLLAALLLFALDALLSLWLRGFLEKPMRLFRWSAPAILLLPLLLHAPDARADDAFSAKAALDTRLAYVVTGVEETDSMSRAGLKGLGKALSERTSYEPQEPIGVNLARDDLSFFPLIYWPMEPRQPDLSPEALSRVSEYMRSGGTILFDTRDLTLGATRGPTSPGEQTLRRLLAKLDVPPLRVVPTDHVLTRAFYLLREFPGRWAGDKVWVEAPKGREESAAPARGGDGVSPVIIGGNDWAAAWAIDAAGNAVAEVVPGGERQREMAIRFGINVVMYSLTGNYKTDQVHVPALLERLGR